MLRYKGGAIAAPPTKTPGLGALIDSLGWSLPRSAAPTGIFGIGEAPPLITGWRWKPRLDRFAQTLCDSECNLL